MNVKKLILKKLNKQNSIKTSELMKETGFSRTYINRFLRELQEESHILKVGKANRTKYVKADKEDLKKIKREIKDIHLTLENKGLSEDLVLDKIERETGIFLGLSENVAEILRYAFTEMLNNAIEHSNSKSIKVEMKKTDDFLHFSVQDFGIGIFQNIKEKKSLANEIEAIQDLLKGKQTTKPKEHSGEGIFFTSKVADMLILSGLHKKIIFNNKIKDVFICNTGKEKSGTKVKFNIQLNSDRKLIDVFRRFTGKGFNFNKTKVDVQLYKMGKFFISRSQARRMIAGLNKFQTIVLDFKNVETVGQAFADEIFRVWQQRYPNKKIVTKNANENIQFMIKRAIKK